MEFVKKNWAKLAIAVVLVTAFVFALINLLSCMGVTGAEGFKDLDKTSKGAINAPLFSWLGVALGLLIATVAVVLNMLEKAEKLVPILFIAAGAIAAIFIVIGMIAGADALKEAKKVLENHAELMGGKDTLIYKQSKAELTTTTLTSLVNLFIFGCLPIVYGLKKLFSRD